MQLKKACASVAALATAFGGLALLAPGAAQAAEPSVAATAPVAFGGSAYGSQVKIAGQLANSGKTAYLSIGCTRKTPITKTNESAAINIAGIGNIGAVTTDATTRGNDTSGVWTAKTQSHVADASLLSDLIEIGAIESEARAFFDDTGYHAAVDYSIASLSIGGTAIVLTGEPNQVVAVPGVGTLTLGETKIKERANSASASITAVVLRFNDSNTVVRIGHSQARVDNATNALFGGGAYGTTVEVAGTITSGKTANQPIGCAGTHGKLKVNEVAGANLGGLGTASGIRSAVRTRQGTPPDSFPEAHATNTIDSVSLSGGLVTLTGVQTRVNVYEKPNGNVRFNTKGSTIAELTVGGVVVTVPPPGGSLVVPGVGTLFFFEVEVLRGGRGVAITAVRLVAAGDTEVVVSHSAAFIR